MARTIVVVDDITGESGAKPVEFALRGEEYSIDLTAEGEEELAALLAPYIEAGTRTGGKKKPARSKPDPDAHLDHGAHTKDEIVAVKDFMQKNDIVWSGLTSGAGRVPVDIWSAWRACLAGDAQWRSRLRPGRLAEPPADKPEEVPAEKPEGAPAPPKRSRSRSRAVAAEQPELVGATA